MISSCFAFRDDAQTKLMALKEKADKELAQYNTELKVPVVCLSSSLIAHPYLLLLFLTGVGESD